MIGDRTLRVEDARFLTGRGRYLADHPMLGLHHVAILRSPVAHARIADIDVTQALAVPGVVAVVTQADLAAGGHGRMAHLLAFPTARPLTWGVLADDAVRFVGEPIAAVVATSRAVAEDACEAIVVDFDELPSVVDPEAALAPGAPLLYEAWGTNVFFDMAGGDVDAVEAALAAAPHVVTERVEHHRIHGLPLETHGAQAWVDPGTGRLTVLASQQQPHQLRTVIAETCGLDEDAVRVLSPDMGGGFGNKQHFSREECLVALLALRTGLPVRWAQDRIEGLTSGIHSREQVHDVTVGFDDDGKVLAYRVSVTSNVGNPVLYFSGIGPSIVTVSTLTGGYDLGEVAWDLRCVATTTCPVGAYRGFGQPQSHLSTERALDRIASELGLDPLDVRRRNLLPDHPRPWVTPGARIDVGSLGDHVDALEQAFDFEEWRARQAAARAEDRFLGIGVSTLVHGTAATQHSIAGRFGSYETACVSVLPDGRVTVVVGTKSQGQGHETAWAQIAADVLCVEVGDVSVRDGDTDALPYGNGTWGSRSAVMGGGAVRLAARQVRDKVDVIASAIGMTGDPRDVVRAVAEIAWWKPHLVPSSIGPGLTATVVYTPGNTMPIPDADGRMSFEETYTTHMTAVAVQVDAVTGQVTILDAVLVSDCGVVINPTLVEGQHQGGFAQAVGAVFLEEIRYDDEAQPLASTLYDYTAPTSGDVPVLRVVHRETPSSVEGGFRGVGEAAIIGCPAALVGAVADALAPLGVRLTGSRLHARHLRRLVRDAGWRPDAAVFGRQT